MQHKVSLADKVAFLQRPDSFPDRPARVETVETHFAWVFLTDRLVYKLKKPIRSGRIDFTDREARHAYCELEVSLNRRIAEAVYLRIVPLTLESGDLAIGGDGEVVDWLVETRRLPGHLTLEAIALRGVVADADLEAVVRKLVEFYRHTPRAPWGGAGYASALARNVRACAGQFEDIAGDTPGLARDAVARIAALQIDFIDRHAALLERRGAEGRVVDAHGDLRPEHVFLTTPPQIIDCLEFSIELRWLDTAEELSFLALECERLGHRELGQRLLTLYLTLAEDSVPRVLLDFYRSRQALIRGLLSAWRVPDAPADSEHKWQDRTHWYVALAEASAASACRGR